jgi:Collagen triple helix repeat (20 copies)
MSRLKRREPFGKAGLTVAICALVLAMVGGAYAAGKLTSPQKKEVEKIAKKFAGKPGAPGANGTNGASGKEGPEGLPGQQGKQGIQGPPGTTGFTKTLPKGETETGDWSLVTHAGGTFEEVGNSASFNIPLAANPVPHYIRATGEEPFYNAVTEKEEEQLQPACPGSAAAPTAKPGSLCVYASREERTATNPIGSIIVPKVCSVVSEAANHSACTLDSPGADKYGFALATFSKESGAVNVVGTWAVTAE